MTTHPPTSADSPGPVVVTGAAGALGSSVVRRFVAAGKRVLAVDVAAERLEPRVAEAPGQVKAHAADLTNAGSVAAMFDAAEAMGGTPAAVVHLVGGFRWSPLAELSDADWRFLIQVNLETSFQVFRETARRFEAAGAGSLVAVSAPAALLGEAGVGAYAATKAAVLRLVESLGREMAAFGGRANAVLPGTMDTPANRASMPDAEPAGWVTTERVAEVIHWLSSDAAAAVNGAAVRVPGPGL
jgi:NAD(P)-dependent dehydrogenase (short-subunit alcohol dehydrogenase family)